MHKEEAKKELIDPKLKEGEQLVGFFISTYTPSFWWFLLIGPLIFLGIRHYIVGITKLGIHLNKLNLTDGLDTHDFFNWNEIESLQFGSGVLTAPLKLKFTNGRKLKLKVQLKGVKKVAKIDEKTKEFFHSKFTKK